METIRALVARLRAEPWFPWAWMLAFGAAILGAIFWYVTPHPSNFQTIVLSLATVAIAIELFGGPKARDRRGRTVASIVMMGAVGVLLTSDFLAIGSFERSNDYYAGGVVPLSDAAGYLKGALSLVEFGHLDEWSSKRPLAVAFLGFLLKVTGENISRAMILQTIFSGVCLAIAVREVTLRLGLTAAVVFLAQTAGHHYIYVGSFMTEPLGFSLGVLGAAMLLRGFGDLDRPALLVGLGMFGLALAARAGPTPATVLLAIYAARHFRQKGWVDWQTAWTSALAVTIPMCVSAVMLWFIGPKKYLLQGNISYSLYGLATGGRGWRAVLVDHPDLFRITSDSDRCRLIYHYFWDAYHRDPWLFWKTLDKSWWKTLHSPFSTLYSNGVPLPYQLFFFPVAAGAAVAFRGFLRKGKDAAGFVLVVMFTVIACFPILYDAWPRDVAPIIGFHGMLAAFGASILLRNRIHAASEHTPSKPTRDAALIACVVLGTLVVVLPLFLRPTRPDLSGIRRPTCEAGLVPMAYRSAKGSGVPIDDQTLKQLEHARLAGLADGKVLTAGGRFQDVVDLLDPDSVASNYAIIENPEAEPPPGQVTYVCSKLLQDGLWWQRLYSVRIVSPP